MLQYRWTTYDIDTIITAATVVLIVSNSKTRTETRYASIPAGYEVPRLNEAGSSVCDVVVPRGTYNFTTSMYAS
jgi:hypothetical protein